MVNLNNEVVLEEVVVEEVNIEEVEEIGNEIEEELNAVEDYSGFVPVKIIADPVNTYVKFISPYIIQEIEFNDVLQNRKVDVSKRAIKRGARLVDQLLVVVSNKGTEECKFILDIVRAPKAESDSPFAYTLVRDSYEIVQGGAIKVAAIEEVARTIDKVCEIFTSFDSWFDLNNRTGEAE